MIPAFVFRPEIRHADVGRNRHCDALAVWRVQMRRIAGKPEEERLGRAQFGPLESVRDPFTIAGEFQLAGELDLAGHTAGQVGV